MTYKSQEFSSKFKILAFPEKFPGKCANCGANHHRDGRQYLDFGLSIPRYGAVYFCTLCITEMAEVIGMMTKADADALTNEWKVYQDTVRELTEKNERLNSVCNVFADYANSDAVRSMLVEASSGSDPSVEAASDESLNIVERREIREKRLVESTDERGSENVFNTTGAEF